MRSVRAGRSKYELMPLLLIYGNAFCVQVQFSRSIHTLKQHVTVQVEGWTIRGKGTTLI